MHDLASFPSMVRRLIESMPQEWIAQRPTSGGFSMLENAWHLADLEVEGYGVRLRRLLDETHPSLPDFRGDAVAEERGYRHLELAPALERFERARAENMKLIAAASEEDRRRTGEQEGVGVVTFARVVEMMAEHDQGHAEELHALAQELRFRGS